MAHFNSSEARAAQDKYCEENGYPHFAPESGKCWSCNREGYPHCSWSFCD